MQDLSARLQLQARIFRWAEDGERLGFMLNGTTQHFHEDSLYGVLWHEHKYDGQFTSYGGRSINP